MYVLMVSVFFGGYTLVDALVRDLSFFDPTLGVLVLFLVAITTGAAWFIAKVLIPVELQPELQLRYLVVQWLRADPWAILLLLSLIVIFKVYSYQQYGVISNWDVDYFVFSEMELPYWFTSGTALVGPLIFCLFLAAASRALVSRGKVRILWIATLAVVLFLAALYGRRSILYLLLMLLILWSLVQGRNLFSLRSGPLVLAGLCVLAALFIYSNLFQNYRATLPTSTAAAGTSEAPNFLDAAWDADATLANLQTRVAMWQFNYLILDGQTTGSRVETPYGGILWQGFKNTVPKALWPEKTFSDLDEMVANLYGLPPTDYPTNHFAVAQADFGYLSVIILPLQLLFVFVSMAVAVRATRRYPTLLLLLSGAFLYYFLTVEMNYADLFVLYRNVFLIAAVYLIVGVALNLPRAALRPRSKGPPSIRPEEFS